MRLTDQELTELNELADLSRAPDAPAALKALNAELAGRYIPADELTISNGQAERPLDGHVLLHDASPLSSHLDNIWPALNGGGVLAARVFGDLSNSSAYLRAVHAFRDPGAVRSMRQSDKAPATVAERVVLCLRVLGQSSVASSLPDVFRSVQRHMTELLLTYPVLLHPKVLVPVERGGANEYMGVLHALSVSSGGLPRLSHLTGPTCGLKAPLKAEEALARLQAFERHPCVRLALRTRSGMHVTIGAGKPEQARDIVRKPTRLLKYAFSMPSPRVQFLASVMELQTVDGGAPGLPFADHTPNAHEDQAEHLERRNLLQALALSMYAATGMIHTPANGAKAAITGTGETLPPPGVVGEPDAPARLSDIWRRHPADSALHAGLRERSGLLRAAPDYDQAVRMTMSKRLFLGRFDELSVDDVRTNAEAVLGGLVESGFEESWANAGACAVLSVLGPDRPGGGLPKAEIQAASAFLDVMEEAGALGTPETPQLQNITDAVLRFPDHPVPFRDNWAQALTVFERTRVLKAAMESSRIRLSQAHSADVEATATSPEPRRRRVML